MFAHPSPTPGTAVTRWPVTAASVVCMAIGLMVLVGWQWDMPFFKSVVPGAVHMKPNTALGLLLAGIALQWRARDITGTKVSRASLVLPFLILLLGSITLLQYALKLDFNIDQMLFKDHALAFNHYPGRMSPLTAWCFTWVGLSLCFLSRPGLSWLIWIAVLQLLMVGMVSLMGYLWGATELVTDALLPPVAVHTSVAMIVLGFGLLAGHYHAISDSARQARLTSVEVKLILALTAALILVTGAFSYTYRLSKDFFSALRLIEHTYEVRTLLHDVEEGMLRLEPRGTGAGDVLVADDPLLLEALLKSVAQMRRSLAALELKMQDNREQLVRLESLKALVLEGTRLLPPAPPLAAPGAGAVAGAPAWIYPGSAAASFETAYTLIRIMDQAERDLLTARKSHAVRDQQRMLVSLLASLGLTVLIFMGLVFAIRREMSHRKRIETAIVEVNSQLKTRVDERTAELEAVNLSLSNFTYSLAHDLRQPLITAANFGALLGKQLGNQGNPKGLDYLGRMTDAVRQINGIAEVILELTRISRCEVTPQPLDISRMCQIIFAAFQIKEPFRSVKLVVQPGMKLVCDDQLMSIGLHHILANAWKFTSTVKGPLIEVGLQSGTPESLTATLFVRDNGVGFDMTYADKLFIPFSSLHTGQPLGGPGTGLAIAQAAIGRNGAKLRAESTVGQGTTIFIAVPLQALRPTLRAARLTV